MGDSAQHYVDLGRQCLSNRQYPQALQCFKKAAEMDPNWEEGQVSYALALTTVGKVDDAIGVLQRTVALNPGAADAHLVLGQRLQDKGDFEGAIEEFNRSLEIKPKNVDAFLGISTSRRLGESDRPLVERMVQLAQDPEMPPSYAIKLNYALGKAFDDLGDFGQAITFVDRAKDLGKKHPLRGTVPFDANLYRRQLEMAKSTFSPEFFKSRANCGSDSELPVFVVGMPRSGTSLLEQILSTHPQIAGIGESNFWEQKALPVYQALTAPQPKGAICQEVAAEYEQLLRNVSASASRITDKTPKNYLHLGQIHATFPNARIVHCRRNPLDTCLSIYMTPFRGQPQMARDRETILFVYRNYLDFMGHWRRVLPPDRFMETDYEELISNREAALSEIVKFCGLEWDDALMNHQVNTRVVQTPSRWQVRQPVYTSSVERWRRYAPWLGEFEALLPPDNSGSGR